jgi:hypothetical protein
LGQASLQVFCIHLLFTFAGLTLLGNATMLSPAKQIALLTGTLAGMLFTAKIFSKSEAKVERKFDLKLGDPAYSSEVDTHARVVGTMQPQPGFSASSAAKSTMASK